MLASQETSEGQFRLGLSEEALRERQSAAVEQSLEIIRRRIDETGVREPRIQRQGSDRILVQLPGVDDPQRIKALIGKTAKMTFHLVDEQAELSDRWPAGRRPDRWCCRCSIACSADGQQRRVVVNRRVMVSGENLVDAQPTFQETSRSSRSASTRRAAGGSATPPARTSANNWRSFSTTR